MQKIIFRGIKNISVDCTVEVFSGTETDDVLIKIDNLNADLQRCGTNSAKKHLKKVSGREAILHRDTNHCISKKLVSTAIGTSSLIDPEDLQGIRERSTVEMSLR